MRVDFMREEQRETALELADVMRLAQEMGRRLANETHGELYEDVREMVNLLHQTRTQADLLNTKINGDDDQEFELMQHIHS